MAALTARDVLEAAGQLLEEHRPPPELPVDLAVHAAAVLGGEEARYSELCSCGARRRLVLTLVTRTRVLQVSAPGRRGADAHGSDVETEVWELTALRDLRLLPPRPRTPVEDGAGASRWDGCRWQLGFDAGRRPVRLPVAALPSSVRRRAASGLVNDLLAARRTSR